MNKLDEQYINLLKDILENGVEKETRNGKVLSVFGRTIRFKFNGNNFPLLTTKKMYWKGIVTELIWFLRGDTNIKFLVDNNCHIWDGDAWKKYKTEVVNRNLWPFLVIDSGKPRPYTQEEFINKIKTDDEFAKEWGGLGPVYGFQWRHWGSEEILVEKSFGDDEGFGYKRKVKEQTKGVDQISELIRLLKESPDSRRMVVNAWNPSDLPNQVLPPCHYSFQVYTRKLSLDERRCWCKNNNVVLEHLEAGLENEEDDMRANRVPIRAISLMWNQRSVDTGLGLSFNIGSYSLLLMMIAKQVNMVPDEVIGNLGDVHLYLNHIEPIKEQLTRESYPLPTVKISDRVVNDISEYNLDDITLENYQSHPPIKMPLSN
jgi:thymidylate synthase